MTYNAERLTGEEVGLVAGCSTPACACQGPCVRGVLELHQHDSHRKATQLAQTTHGEPGDNTSVTLNLRQFV